MSERLAGKVALITGGARGQGAAEGALFAAEGARVILADVLDAEGEAAAAGIGEAASYRHLDVSDEDAWNTLVAEIVEDHGKLDVLVNNAGVYRSAPVTGDGSGDLPAGDRDQPDRRLAGDEGVRAADGGAAVGFGREHFVDGGVSAAGPVRWPTRRASSRCAG